MNNTELLNESNEATYCPEDDKLRLYVGRVPRDEFLALRKEGWTCTPKQDCDFVAHWRVEREDTALSYAGYIGDEDQSPADRAADRADRFGGYLDKRRSEAHELADNFNNGPSVHGYQNQARAERSAKRHDRIADKSVIQWSKAEYWQQRTAGVISNALYKLRPSVRMGRIKDLEKSERNILSYSEGETRYPRYLGHIRLKLQYEKSMLEASGGCASDIEMVAGGFLSGYQIHTVNKSSASGKITSVKLINNDKTLKLVNIERMGKPVYKDPTSEDLEALKLFKKQNRESKPKKMGVTNPTKEGAEKLQAIFNETENKRSQLYSPNKDVIEITEMTQKQYSIRAQGSYGPCSTKFIGPDGKPTYKQYYGNIEAGAVCKVRTFYGSFSGGHSIVVITDKPQKDLPAFEAIEVEV